MSLLSKVVNFKELANQLKSTEFDQFLAKITKNIGKEIILKLLCSPFIQSTSINNDQSLLDNMIKIISNIIQSRKIKENQQKNITKIDQFPTPLIGAISCYLKQKEYSLFSRTNRSLFVSCNTPNTLTNIHLYSVSNYSSIKLQNYPQITELAFNLCHINEFQINHQLSLNRLQTVIMDGSGCSNKDIEQFININQNYLNLNNLRVALFVNFTVGYSDFAQFIQLLSQFKMIEHLDLYHVKIRGNINTEKVRELFPNLSRCSFIDGTSSFSNAILNEYGSNLECLSFNERDTNYAQINFAKLQRLLACDPLNKSMNDILQTAKGLKDVVFAPYLPNDDSLRNHYISGISEIIKKLIVDQKSLELLYIPLTSDIVKSVVDSVENALYNIKNRRREEFKIKFIINCYDKIKATDFMIYISRIFNVLNASNIKDFIIIWECDKNKKYDLSEMLDAMNALIESVPNAQLIKATQKECIVGNKNCKINGYNDWWNDVWTVHM